MVIPISRGELSFAPSSITISELVPSVGFGVILNVAPGTNVVASDFVSIVIEPLNFTLSVN